MKHKRISFISAVLIATFAWQSTILAKDDILRPQSAGEKWQIPSDDWQMEDLLVDQGAVVESVEQAHEIINNELPMNLGIALTWIDISYGHSYLYRAVRGDRVLRNTLNSSQVTTNKWLTRTKWSPSIHFAVSFALKGILFGKAKQGTLVTIFQISMKTAQEYSIEPYRRIPNTWGSYRAVPLRCIERAWLFKITPGVGNGYSLIDKKARIKNIVLRKKDSMQLGTALGLNLGLSQI